jgi:ribonuclease P protein component
MTSGGAERPMDHLCHAAPVRLKSRAEFVAASRGSRRHTQHFTLQVRRRDDADPARFGVTITKKTVPLAVGRNRIRRRLREALRQGAALSATPGHDYVIVARETAVTASFATLKQDLAAALSGRIRDRRPKSRPAES